MRIPYHCRALLWLAFLGLSGVLTGQTGTDDSGAIFVDFAADSGLDFVHFNGMSGELYYPEMVGGGVALLDYAAKGPVSSGRSASIDDVASRIPRMKEATFSLRIPSRS